MLVGSLRAYKFVYSYQHASLATYVIVLCECSVLTTRDSIVDAIVVHQLT